VSADRARRAAVFAYGTSRRLLRTCRRRSRQGRITPVGTHRRGKSTLVQCDSAQVPAAVRESASTLRAARLELTHLRSIIVVVPQTIGVFNAIWRRTLCSAAARGLQENEIVSTPADWERCAAV
jgi:hypothetical protein